MLRVETRDWFDALRKTPEAEASRLSEDERLIRQFLRGDAEGPITERRNASSFAEDLLGPDVVSPVPSVVSTKA